MAHSLLLGLLLVWTQAPSTAQVRRIAYARVPLALKIAADPAIAGFLAAKNAQSETPEQLREKDVRWTSGRDPALKQAVTTGPCAEKLREMVKADPFILEAMLIDVRGGLVCATAETSDYWQGDEAKWQKTVRDGGDVFVDEPTFDQSARHYAIQLSVAIVQDGKHAGALTLTVKVPSTAAPTG